MPDDMSSTSLRVVAMWVLSILICIVTATFAQGLSITKQDQDATGSKLECGIVWFVHIGKTGGGTVQQTMYKLAGRSVHGGVMTERNGVAQDWTFIDLYSYKHCDPALKEANMSMWETSATWQHALRELGKEKPRLFVHQHHCSPGVNKVYAQLQMLNKTLQKRGCRVSISTLVREPLSRVQSAIFFVKPTPTREELEGFIANGANVQTDYLLDGHRDVLPYTTQVVKCRRPNMTRLRQAMETLKGFDLIGRTTRMDEFIGRLTAMISVPAPAKTPHVHAVHSRPYNLTNSDFEKIRNCNALDELMWQEVQTLNAFVGL